MSEVPPLLRPLHYLKETWEGLPQIAIWPIRIVLCLLFIIPWLAPPGLQERAPAGGPALSVTTGEIQAARGLETLTVSQRAELADPSDIESKTPARIQVLESDRKVQDIEARSATGHRRSTPRARSWTATLVPHTFQRLSVRISGRIEGFPCKEGGVFTKGEPLFQLRDNRAILELERAGSQVRASLAQVKEAELECGNLQDLFENEAATQREVRRAETMLATARARHLEATIREKLAILDLESCREQAPFTGVVSRILFEKGEYIRKGEVLMEIFDPEQVQAVIRVKRQDLALFGRGQKVRFISDSGESQDGVVETVGVRQDPAAGTVRVAILIQNEDSLFWPGSSGRIVLGRD